MRADRNNVDACPDQPTSGLRRWWHLWALGLGFFLATPLAGATCEMQEQTHRSGRVLCTIGGHTNKTAVRFEAHFGGFHDDSVVEMMLRLDGTDVPCGARDRMALSGESGDEGEVSLFCRLDVAPADGRARVLEGLLSFRHAELSSVRLVPDPTAEP